MGVDIKTSWILCRVCLEPEQIGMISIHDKYKEYCIIEYINKLTSVNIKSTDCLPDKICNNCFMELKVALSFIEKCEKADKNLKTYSINLIQSYKENIKVESDVPEIKQEESVNSDVCDIDDTDNIQYSFVYEQDKKEHKTPESEVKCHDCGNVFKSKCKLRVHWKQTHMLEALICPHCKRRFKTYKTMHLHLKNKSKACLIACDPNVIIEGEGKLRIFHCKECGHKSPRIKDIEAHLRIHNGERPFQCDLCHKGFSQHSSLQHHKEATHKKYARQITCQHCGKIVKGRQAMYLHLRSHRAVTPCSICQKPVAGHNLKKHMLRHTGVKSYTCEICAAAFYSSSELYNHRRYIHVKSVVYNCDICNYTSVRKAVFEKHKSKHSEKKISCNICGKFSTTAERAILHKILHSSNGQYECPHCQQIYTNKDSIRKHMLRKHKSVVNHNINMDAKCESQIEIPKTSPS